MITACFCLACFCQNNTILASIDNFPTPKNTGDNVVIYTVGEQSLGFPIENKRIPKGFVTTEDNCPVLQYYAKIKKEFIGKKIIFESSNDTLIIKNLKFTEGPGDCGTLVFETGKKNLNFSSDIGYILVENKEVLYLGMIGKEEKNFYKILK